MSRILRFLVVAAVLGVLIYLSLLNQLTYHYEVPAGGDALNHLSIVDSIQAGNYGLIFKTYSLWHLLVIVAVKITGLPAITAMAWLGPLLVGFGSVALYAFNRRFFNHTAGLVSAIIFGLMVLQPLQTLHDGGFPNFLAAAIVLPVTLLVVEGIFSSQTLKLKLLFLVLSLVMTALLLLAHHITAMYGLLIILLLLFYELLKKIESWPLGKIWVLLTPPLLFLGFVGLVRVFLITDLVGSARGLAQAFIRTDNVFPFIHLSGQLDNPNALVPLLDYPTYIGESVIYLGILGALVGLGKLLMACPAPQKRASLMLLAWATILAVASQQEGLGFPIRLARDLAVPLVLLAGLFVGWAVDYIARRRLPVIFSAIIIALALGLGTTTLRQRLDQITRPDPLVYHLKVDAEAAKKIIAQTPAKSKILVFYDDAYLSLFIGDRSVITVTSQAAEQIANPTAVSTIVPNAQYVYVERRFDRPKSAVNHDGIPKSYLSSSAMSLIFHLEQPEKHVYLFKVVTPTAKVGRGNGLSR